MVTVRTIGSLCLLMGLLLSGCVGGEANDTDPSATATSTLDAGEGQEGTEVGSIQGFVRDDELRQVPGAQVALLKTSYSVESDASGAFAIVNLPAAEYTVIAQKLGYESSAQKVVVKPGETIWVNLTLLPILASDAYTDTSQHTTQLQCMLTTSIWVSSCSYPYTAVYLTLHDHGVNASNYGLPPDIMTNKWRYNYSVAPGVETVVSEMQWKPVSESAKDLQLRQCRPDYDPILDDCTEYASAHGASPVSFHWEPSKAVFEGATAGWVMSAVWPNWGAFTSTSQGIFLDQKVEMWNTEFYGEPAPEEWSIFTAPG